MSESKAHSRGRRSSMAGGGGAGLGGAGLDLSSLHPGLAMLGRSRPGSPGDSITDKSLESARSDSSAGTMNTGADKAGKPFRHPHGTYEGETNSNLVPQGYGCYFYKNGDVYKGEWENGIREGDGEMTYTTGERYSGEYHLSLAHGDGEYKFMNGDSYKGAFKHGFMHGRGKYTYHTGDVYIGYMRKGSKCDNVGRFMYKNGDQYMGRFHENVPYGRGQIFLKKTREVPNPAPLQVWNGVLIEQDPRPSKNGAFTNFDPEFDQPRQYVDSDSSSSSEDDESTRASSPSMSVVSRYSATSSTGPTSGGPEGGSGRESPVAHFRPISPTLYEEKES